MMSARHVWVMVIAASASTSIRAGVDSPAQGRESSRVDDRALGIAFTPVGRVTKTGDATYSMAMVSPVPSPAPDAVAEVSVSDRLFVDLPGSYGGRFYLDSAKPPVMLRSLLTADSLARGGNMYRREYWIVYAGMGMWEGVINCYTRAGGKFCIVSLIKEAPMGKPGERMEEGSADAEDIRARFLSTLRDSTAPLIERFDSLLSSVQLTGQ